MQDLFEDVALNNKNFSPEKILTITVTQYNYKFIPVFKYLSKMNIGTLEDYNKSGLKLDQYIQRDFPDVFASRKARDFVKYQGMTFNDFTMQQVNPHFYHWPHYILSLMLSLLRNSSEKIMIDLYLLIINISSEN